MVTEGYYKFIDFSRRQILCDLSIKGLFATMRCTMMAIKGFLFLIIYLHKFIAILSGCNESSTKLGL